MLYKYQAKKITGEETSGTMEASSKTDLAVKLREQGYIPTLVKEKNEKSPSVSFLSGFGLVSAADKIMFAKNLGVMLSAGLPLTRALEILSRQTNNGYFSRTIISLMNDVKKGDFLSGAMMNPAIILIAMVLIAVFMFIYVVPTLVATFKELNVDLPLSTQAIIFISDSITKHTYLFIIFFLAVVFSALWFLRTEKGKIFLGNMFLKTPLISPVVKKINSARTSRTLATLISSGVNVVEALAITRDVLQNNKYKEVLTRAMDDVQKGIPISNSFKEATKIYPVLLGEMMAVGEETGKIAEMLEKIAVFYEEETAEATKNMATVIEPILMIFIGAAVGFFALSMIKPMYSMMNGI